MHSASPPLPIRVSPQARYQNTAVTRPPRGGGRPQATQHGADNHASRWARDPGHAYRRAAAWARRFRHQRSRRHQVRPRARVPWFRRQLCSPYVIPITCSPRRRRGVVVPTRGRPLSPRESRSPTRSYGQTRAPMRAHTNHTGGQVWIRSCQSSRI